MTAGSRARAGCWLVVALLMALAGCGPRISVGPIGDSGAARQALVDASAEGAPVFAQVYGNPFGLEPARRDSLVTDGIAEGVYGMAASFATDPAAVSRQEPRLVVLLNPLSDPSGDIVCRSPGQIHAGGATGELRVVAAFCTKDKLLNMARGEDAVSGPTDLRLDRLLWRVGSALFPDDYENSYGLDWIPWLDVGIGGSFGF